MRSCKSRRSFSEEASLNIARAFPSPRASRWIGENRIAVSKRGQYSIRQWGLIDRTRNWRRRARYIFRSPEVAAFARAIAGSVRGVDLPRPLRWREDFAHECNNRGLATRGARHFQKRALARQNRGSGGATRCNKGSRLRPEFAEA